jgi:parallel beta-helix repeat protein
MSKTHVVEPNGKFPTVSAAIKAADRDDRILVRPGRYEESLFVDKPLEIIGDGPRYSIEIWGTIDAYVLHFAAVYGRVAGLTLRQPGAGKNHGVGIRLGRLDLEDCDISSDPGSCVYVYHGADPVLRRNLISNGKHHGVFVYEGGRGTFEDNEIVGCHYANVQVQEGSTPVFRRNVIRDSVQSGIRVANTGFGLFEENVITGNGHSGVAIEAFGYPTLRRNRITLNADYGVRVFQDGAGVVEDNDLTGNRHGAWHIEHDKHTVTRARNRE